MGSLTRKFGFASLSLLALALGLGCPVAAFADPIVYQNNSNLVVVVVASSKDKLGRDHFGPPHKLGPKETTWDQVAAPGDKRMIITDPKNPKTIYYEGKIDVDRLYIIETNAGGKVQVREMPIPAMMQKK
jgi:hypothetical protein